jgi:hypothetical protein
MIQQRRFEISFIYTVSVDEGKLYQDYIGITDEEREDAKQLLHGALQNENVADYLLVREIAWNLADLGEHEQMPEVLTGYGADDYTPALAALDQLPLEKRQFWGDDGEEIVHLLDNTLDATLDHVHVRRLQAHEHVPSPQDEGAASPAAPPSKQKQRHHKQKSRRKK